MSALPVSVLLNGQPKIQEHGRTYYRDWRRVYPYPCDRPENDRLDLLHKLMYKDVLQSLHVATIKQPSQGPLRILDVGCGTGIWVEEAINTYPQAHIIAFDISDAPFGPRINTPNVQYLSGVDFESNYWGQPEQSFHFIHCGQLNGSISNWPLFLYKVFRLLLPGGQLELVDIDWEPRFTNGPLPTDSWISYWWQALQNASRSFGKSVRYTEDQFQPWLQQAGFSVANHRSERLEVAEDPTLDCDESQCRIARSVRVIEVDEDFCHLENLAMALLTTQLGWSAADVQRVCAKAVLEINRKHCPLYHVLHVWTARRPTSQSSYLPTSPSHGFPTPGIMAHNLSHSTARPATGPWRA